MSDSRRRAVCGRRAFLAAGILALSGCGGKRRQRANVLTWGRQDARDGDFIKPRAIGVNDGEVYVIDTTGRVQVFTPEGRFLRKWSMPASENGTPTSVTFPSDGAVVIPDTHYSRIIRYTPKGEELERWGAYGVEPGRFIYPTDIVHGAGGRMSICEYGMEAERVQVFDAQHRPVAHWGTFGEATGQFNRAMGIAGDPAGNLYVADSANHRIQCFDATGAFVRAIGKPGPAPGDLRFPYDVTCASDGSLLVCEYGNNRISRFRGTGEYVGLFGGAGRGPGQFDAPRGVAVSPDGVVYVADTNNHRIQRFHLEDML